METKVLHKAVYLNQVHDIKKGLLVDVDVNERDTHGRSSLYIAAQENRLDIVKLLLDNNAHIDSKNFEGQTPLQIAAKEGHHDVVDYITKKGADIHSADTAGMTALSEAISHGHLEIVKLLIQYGAMKGTETGWTPVHVAAEAGHLKIVEYLASCGADLHSLDNDGSSPLHVAARKGHFGIVKYLISQGGDETQEDKNGDTPIRVATIGEHLDVVEYLVSYRKQSGKDVDAKFYEAALNGDLHQLKECLHNPDIHCSSHDGPSPLTAASFSGNLDCVECLVSAGALVNGQGEGWTPLHAAAQEGHLDIVRYLVSKGVDLKATDEEGLTPLHSASLEGHLDIVQYLYSQGSDIDVHDNEGMTPICLATQRGHLDIVKYLRSKVSEGIDSLIHIAAEEGHLNITAYLVSEGVNINGENSQGQTAVVLAQGQEYQDIVDFLVTKGADLDLGGEGGFDHESPEDNKGEILEASQRTSGGVGSTNVHAEELHGGISRYLISHAACTQKGVKHPIVRRGYPVQAKSLVGQVFPKLFNPHCLWPALSGSWVGLITTFFAAMSCSVGAVGSETNAVIITEGKNASIEFHVDWSTATHREVYYTIKIDAQERPFCANGHMDPLGFAEIDQSDRFTVTSSHSTRSLCVNLTIQYVRPHDQGNYVFFPIIVLGDRMLSIPETKRVTVYSPLGPAVCFISRSDYSTKLYEVHCNARTGSRNGTITCFQNMDKLPFKNGITSTRQRISGVFWLTRYDLPVSCCSHESQLGVPEESCVDFVWPNKSAKNASSKPPLVTKENAVTISQSSHTLLSNDGCPLVGRVQVSHHYTFMFILLIIVALFKS